MESMKEDANQGSETSTVGCVGEGMIIRVPTENTVSCKSRSRYHILRSIISNNLYGVDIMQEAVEICKLSLFLKLLAHVERVEDIGVLAGIDCNIRTAHKLVGFVPAVEAKVTEREGIT